MKKTTKLVVLEPVLEQIAGDFSAAQCVRLAKVYRRWARQLSVKAKVLRAHSVSSKPRPEVRPLHPRRLVLN